MIRLRWIILSLLCGGLVCTADDLAAKKDASGEGGASDKNSVATDDYFQMNLEELMDVTVVTASKKEELKDDAPNQMYVITASQIKRRGYHTLKDVLEVIPGFGVFHRDLQYVAQVRGIAPNENEKIAFMINGHIINQVAEPEVFDGSGIRLDGFERIEIIVGPGSVLYGGEALCAIVNMITKKTNGKYVRLAIGNYSTYAGSASIGQTDEDSSFYVYGSYSEHDGFDAWLKSSENPRNQMLAGTSLTGKLYPSVMFLGTFEKENWSATFFGQNSQMPDLHLHGFGVATDGRRYNYIYSGIVKNQTEWFDGFSTTFKIGGDVKRMLRSLVARDADMPDHPSWDLSQTSYETELALQYKEGASFAQAGIQYKLKQNRHNYDFLWDPDRPYSYGDATMRSIADIDNTYALGFYLSEEYALLDNLNVVGAIRWDRDTTLNNDFYGSPRVALVYRPTDYWISKLIYNKATRVSISPWGSRQNHLWGNGVEGAPDWASQNAWPDTPEKLETYEFQNIFYIYRARLSLNLYHQTLNDYYSWFSPWTTVGKFEGNGCELDVLIPLSAKLSLWANFATSDNDFSTDASLLQQQGTISDALAFQLPANDKGEVVAVPRETANLGLDWNITKDIYGSTTLRYFNQQPMYLDGKWDYADNRVYLDASMVVDNFMLKRMSLQGAVKNILDNRDPVGTQWLADAYRPRGMSFEIALAYEF